jgi:predicted small lipoprotein YifL
MNAFKYMLAVLGVLALGACGSREPPPLPPPPLAPAEVFTWTDRPIEFQPPPATWQRHRNQQRLIGVRFQIPRIPPGRITIGDYHLLHRSHRRIWASGQEQWFDPPPPGFTLADVVDRVRFDPTTMPGGAQVQPEVERSVGGFPAIGLDYTWNDGTHTFQGREVYFVAGQHLFAATLLGAEEDLDLFERIVATIRFPPPPLEPQ